MASDAEHEVVIVGSGFGGLGMAVALRRAGVHDFAIFEKARELGGTWRDNAYPGAACDIPSHLYSFSFAPKPDWSHKYAPHDEILAYLHEVARHHGLAAHIELGRELVRARFDEPRRRWELECQDGHRASARFVVAACGQLGRPAYPSIPGLDTFTGRAFHTARWDRHFDPRGQRVAVIGTGASAIQVVPALAQTAASLAVFQRSAPYVVPRHDRAYGPAERALYERLPAAQKLSRAWVYASHEWRALGFMRPSGPLQRFGRWLWRRHLEAEVRDLELRHKLTPDYPMGCKRVLISSDYYPALALPHVELVTEPIVSVAGADVVTADGRRRPCDALVYGTGFQATDFLGPIAVTGSAGRQLTEAWRAGAQAYLGMAVSGFPNLFLLYGPNTNLGHSSIVFMLESQVRYVMGCLALARRTGARALDVRPAVQARFHADLQARLRRSVWGAGCTSWYKTSDGVQTNNWPGFTFDYRFRTRRPDPADFRMLV
ncbi:MAG: NAD(P)/FAD-dependent oxidoreductase [Myxococcales bacterium]|nr:NAD(P)/FAD-dependent oxidoreductase [Myxococcales bacterium]